MTLPSCVCSSQAADAAATQGWVPPGGTSRQQLQSAARRRAEVHAGGPGWVEGPIVAPLRMLQWLSQVRESAWLRFALLLVGRHIN